MNRMDESLRKQYEDMKLSIESDLECAEQALKLVNQIWVTNQDGFVIGAVKEIGSIIALLKRKLVEVEIINPDHE